METTTKTVHTGEYQDAVMATAEKPAPIATVPAPPPTSPPQLLDALRPAERVALMTEISNVIQDVIEKQKWFKVIGPKKHILIQGWTFIGGLGGCSAKTTSTEKIEGGYKAHAVVVRVDSGIEVGSADQVCLKAESNWRGKDDYALIGMASTRACSRALSTVFRHIVELAGYSATPAEEMTGTGFDPDPKPAKAPEPERRRPEREEVRTFTPRSAQSPDFHETTAVGHDFLEEEKPRGRSAHGLGAPVDLLNRAIAAKLCRNKDEFVELVKRHVPGGASVKRSSDVAPGSALHAAVTAYLDREGA